MLAELIARVAALDLKPLAVSLARELAARGETVAAPALEAHLRDLVDEPANPASFLGAAEHRVHALAAAVERHLGLAPARPAPAAPPPTSAPPAPASAALAAPTRSGTPAAPSPGPASSSPPPPPLDVPTLRARVRGLAGVIVGAPKLDHALLTGTGSRTYVWLEGPQVVVIGAASPAVAAACQPTPVAPPSWLAHWRALTAPGNNPWQLPSDVALDDLVGAALDRTADAAPRDPYRTERPGLAFRAALAVWARAEIAALGARMAATVSGEVTPIGDGAGRRMLAALAGRSAALSAGALVPLLLADMASGPLVLVAPTPPGIALDVIGRAAAGCVRVRVAHLGGAPTGFRAIVLPRAPRGATTVEAGDVLVALFGP